MRRNSQSVELIRYHKEQELGNAQAPQLEAVRALKLYQSLGLWKVPLESVNTVGN